MSTAKWQNIAGSKKLFTSGLGLYNVKETKHLLNPLDSRKTKLLKTKTVEISINNKWF